MTELYLVAGLARERGHGFRLRLGGERGDALRNVAALLVEGVFPEQASKHGAPELAFRVHLLRHRSLVRPHREKPLPYVHFLSLLPLLLSPMACASELSEVTAPGASRETPESAWPLNDSLYSSARDASR